MYFFMHSPGGRLYIHTNMVQVLCVLLWLPNGLSPSVLAPSLMFLESPPNSRNSRSNAFHWLESEGCVSSSSFSGSLSSPGFFLSACHRMSLASLGFVK